MVVFRSPGGTPYRTKPLETEGTDATSIIAIALKKKFAQRRKLRDADSPSMYFTISAAVNEYWADNDNTPLGNKILKVYKKPLLNKHI